MDEDYSLACPPAQTLRSLWRLGYPGVWMKTLAVQCPMLLHSFLERSTLHERVFAGAALRDLEVIRC